MTTSVLPQSAAEATTTATLRGVSLRVAILTLLVLVLFGTVLVDMAKDWWTEPQLSQDMLLPLLALFIAWIERGRVLAEPYSTDRRGIWITAFACAVFLLGRLASEFFMTRFSFVILLAGIICTFWGMRRLRALLFPVLLLATMIPLPAIVYNSISGPLQLLASDIAARIAQASGISVFRDGNIIQLAHISLGVAEACSGLSSLSALVVVSFLFAYLLCSGWRSRLVLILASVPLAIAVNVSRVAGTALLADYDQDFALGFYHLFSGWLVFVAGFGLLYLLARLSHLLLD